MTPSGLMSVSGKPIWVTRDTIFQPCDALDPYRNLAVTAALLREHHTVTGDWVLAAGRYHRPAGGAPAARYRAGFSRQLEGLLISLNEVTPP
jgi:hypothetical protein